MNTNMTGYGWFSKIFSLLLDKIEPQHLKAWQVNLKKGLSGKYILLTYFGQTKNYGGQV